MADENIVTEDAKMTEAEPVVEETKIEPTEVVSEDAKTPVEKDYKTKYEESLAAIREERAKRKELQAQVAETQTQPVVQPADDEVYRDYLGVKANAYIGMKMQTDPSFKDRLDIVEEFAKSMPIEQADEKAKALIFDRLQKEMSSEEPVVKPKQIKQGASSESEAENIPPSSYNDIVSGKANSQDARLLRETLKRFGGGVIRG